MAKLNSKEIVQLENAVSFFKDLKSKTAIENSKIEEALDMAERFLLEQLYNEVRVKIVPKNNKIG